MNRNPTIDSEDAELLLRWIDGNVTAVEREQVGELLRTNVAARTFLREISEHSVMVADLERMAQGHERVPAGLESKSAGHTKAPVLFPRWWFPQRGWLAAAIALMLLITTGALLLVSGRNAEVARISKFTGASHFVGSRSDVERTPEIGTRVRAGDILETRSCDSWIELQLRDGSKLTVAGQSTLRVLGGNYSKARVKLQSGNLWFSPTTNAGTKRLVVQTPTAEIEVGRAQFDLHSSAAETRLRVNEGKARATRIMDLTAVEVAAGEQVSTALGRVMPLAVQPQPNPVNSWTCENVTPKIVLGRWLPPNDASRTRLAAEPLLWPIGDRNAVLYHVVGLSVQRSSVRPVQLVSGSKFVFRGRTDRPQMVRFGFTTQKMQGVFAGKFELDVPPNSLGTPGEIWTVELALEDFHPLQSYISSSPLGFELNEVYALTVRKDVGLEIHHVELISGMQE